jgi:hypothetical protein
MAFVVVLCCGVEMNGEGVNKGTRARYTPPLPAVSRAGLESEHNLSLLHAIAINLELELRSRLRNEKLESDERWHVVCSPFSRCYRRDVLI